jgi:hypothetical protein
VLLSNKPKASCLWYRERLKKEGNQPVTNYHGLKITAAYGRKPLTDAADTEQLLFNKIAEY